MSIGVKSSHQVFFAMLKQMILACLGGAIATFAAFFLAANLIVSRELSMGIFTYLAMLGLCLGCFSCGMILAMLHKEGWMLCGIWSFLLFASVMALFAWCDGMRSITSTALICAMVLLFSGCLGGWVGVNNAVKHAKHRHK